MDKDNYRSIALEALKNPFKYNLGYDKSVELKHLLNQYTYKIISTEEFHNKLIEFGIIKDENN